MFDVAIVGYGPAGVVLAGLLGQAGLSVHVCDRKRGVYEIPRAISLDHEILRVFQQLGVVDAVLPHTEPFTNSEWFGADGRLIRRMTMLPPPHPQGYTPSVVFTQPAVERVLRERVAQLPNVQVVLGTEAMGFDQDADAVTLQLRRDDGTESRVRARWLVACDGGSSRLRTLAGIALEDLGFDEPWLVVDVHVNERGLARLPRTSVQYCEPGRPCTMVIGPGNHRRWEISLKPGEDAQQAATPEGTWALLSRWLTPDEGTLWRQASYRFHALVAERWRAGTKDQAGPGDESATSAPSGARGRFFVAGDAAHMQPPFLGQGMCQGVRDVANLAWKLAAVAKGEVHGAAAEALLDSYGAERKAHVRELTTRLKAIGAVICERDADRARARDARLLDECGGVVKDTPRQDVLPRLEPSAEAASLLSPRATSGRGTLFPQPRLEDAIKTTGVLMDRRCGTGWRLVIGAGGSADLDTATLATSMPKDVAVVALARPGQRETEGVVAAWMQRHGCHAALVRPDHYVFGTATSAEDLQALLAERAAALGH